MKLANAVQWINFIIDMVSWETSRHFSTKQGARYSPQWTQFAFANLLRHIIISINGRLMVWFVLLCRKGWDKEWAIYFKLLKHNGVSVTMDGASVSALYSICISHWTRQWLCLNLRAQSSLTLRILQDGCFCWGRRFVKWNLCQMQYQLAVIYWSYEMSLWGQKKKKCPHDHLFQT